jgi:copper chaperone CopZ
MKGFLTGVLLMMSAASFAEEINVKVNGMVCSMCAQGIQKKFKALPEVKSLEVDLDKKFVKIQSQDNAKISDETITNLIKEAGYHVERIERK